jgi:SAM-dependent methyltransferase
MNTETILDLGKQPIANKFLSSLDESDDEYFYRLKVVVENSTGLVSLKTLVPPEKMFNDDYVYHSSGSQTMRDHFRNTATMLSKKYSPQSVLEIGSNDGAFLKNWDTSVADSVEPCGNFAAITNSLGYKTLANFWDQDTAKELDREYDLIYSANCFCHIHDLYDAFKAVKLALSLDGVLVIEDPSLYKMVKRNSYDQLYDEHAHIFSVYALDKLTRSSGLRVIHVEELSIHGGSNRVYISRADSSHKTRSSVGKMLHLEKTTGITTAASLSNFEEQVSRSKKLLHDKMHDFKRKGHKIISYGATSKSTTVFNYCELGTDIFDYIIDTTQDKIGKYSPGTHIPVVNHSDGIPEDVTVAFLGAWNFEKEIVTKEQSFLSRGGIFVTHVPQVREIRCL